ncbi:DUF2577 domain-containing protein [Paenibacillus alvei]|uniref:DUF2577 domain-containing protein n=1 Tax=Paenibacillus alvei TaxID=44250 RepID=UPI000289AFD1|nr:DUF2577 domain-containing protein [Paenibacillus alvei]EJW14713.1 hypothetical protein PAV_11c00540 [Paenibacillus alvei DSM 29]MCY9540912.1 DUF2577 domain-containing protein [Paenibacillus alvei]MCY9708184.1 DUF2577 domain-containing protein [Paenibacillus alvei]MEC0080183.1 DUF2577 domain-containing protein [Paenibacillus alvei]NEZ43302.1 DUF2577 domain-containing protein [Paenibacillus alvei]
MNLLEVIKKAAADAVDAGSPMNVLYGTVISSAPIKITVDQRFSLTKEFLILCEAVQELNVEISGAKHVIRKGLQAGDTVILLRVQGGQQYVVLDRVVVT